MYMLFFGLGLFGKMRGRGKFSENINLQKSIADPQGDCLYSAPLTFTYRRAETLDPT